MLYGSSTADLYDQGVSLESNGHINTVVSSWINEPSYNANDFMYHAWK